MSYATKDEADFVEQAAVRWGQNFLACRDAGLRGFRVTPYTHLVKDHVPALVRVLGGLNRFSGEQLERLNDLVKVRLLVWKKSQRNEVPLVF